MAHGEPRGPDVSGHAVLLRKTPGEGSRGVPATESFGQRLYRLMTERRLTGAAVSRAVGCSQQGVSKWIRGGNIDEEHLRSLADFLEVDWLWLRYGDEVVKERARQGAISSVDELRVETFRRLVQAEERLSSAIEAATLGTWDWDISSNTLTLSERMASIMGLGDSEVTVPLASFLAVIHRQDVETVSSTVSAAARHMRPFQIDVRVNVPDASTRWLFFAGRFTRDRQTQAVRGMGIGRDISGRKQIEENLRADLSFYARLFDRTSSLLMTLNARGRVTRCNESARRLLGVGDKDIHGREFCELISAWASSKPAYHTFDFKAGRYPHSFEAELQSRLGTFHRISWFVERLGGGSGYLACGHVLEDEASAAAAGARSRRSGRAKS